MGVLALTCRLVQESVIQFSGKYLWIQLASEAKWTFPHTRRECSKLAAEQSVEFPYNSMGPISHDPSRKFDFVRKLRLSKKGDMAIGGALIFTSFRHLQLLTGMRVHSRGLWWDYRCWPDLEGYKLASLPYIADNKIPCCMAHRRSLTDTHLDCYGSVVGLPLMSHWWLSVNPLSSVWTHFFMPAHSHMGHTVPPMKWLLEIRGMTYLMPHWWLLVYYLLSKTSHRLTRHCYI